MTQDEKKYYGWLWCIKLFGRLSNLFTEETKLSPNHWRDYYDNGLSAIEALKEDFKYV